MITPPTLLAQTTEPAASAETPELVLAVALIGVLGIALGGVIQLITQRWAIMHDRMVAMRQEVSRLGQSVSSYTSNMVQSARVISGIRDEFIKELEKDSSAKLDLDEDYWSRLGEAFFNSFRDTQEISTALQSASDYRISAQATEVHILLVDTHNEVAEMFTGELHLTENEAKERQRKLNDAAAVLLNMTGPRWWERHWRFRSARRAQRILSRGREKRAKAKVVSRG
ncbi:hypothetical protein [Arthrobacter sp. G119Y2]|uniref:hypothetical protein n=1 Tax=Arthrobacter sp. G119Y2 TaxID=3134965 RepID=UPI0031191A67